MKFLRGNDLIINWSIKKTINGENPQPVGFTSETLDVTLICGRERILVSHTFSEDGVIHVMLPGNLQHGGSYDIEATWSSDGKTKWGRAYECNIFELFDHNHYCNYAQTKNENVNIKTVELESVVRLGGQDGKDGKSAYRSYLDTTTDDPTMSEAEWAKLLRKVLILEVPEELINIRTKPGKMPDDKWLDPIICKNFYEKYFEYETPPIVFFKALFGTGYIFQTIPFSSEKGGKIEIVVTFELEMLLMVRIWKNSDGNIVGKALYHLTPQLTRYEEKQVKITNTDGTVTNETILIKKK